MEASALPASVGIGRTRTRIAIGASLLRIRSDEQLVTFFREGNDNAFDVIYDRYQPRLCAYTRQMLSGGGHDAEGAVQDIFTRAYYGLRANNRELALRSWLYRIAHNRCIDELRRPQAVAVEAIDSLVPNVQDPVARAEQREALRRLIADVRRLPDQQRSALLMRELSGMSYADVSGALGVTVPAVKSLLVRARVSLAQASEARDTACAEIREDLIVSHDRGVRTSGLARRHMRDCSECRRFRTEVRGVNRNLAALAPTLGPLGVVANLLGFGGGGAASGGAASGGAVAGGGAAAGAAGTGAAASTGLLAGSATHVATLLAATVVAAGGAVELHNTLATHHRTHHHAAAIVRNVSPARARTAPAHGVAGVSSTSQAGSSATQRAPTAAQTAASREADAASPSSHTAVGTTASQPLTMTLDPDNLRYANTTMPGSSPTPNQTAASREGDGTSTSSPAVTTGTGSTTGTGADGTSGPGATGTGGPASTSTGSTATSSPVGATTSPSSSSSGSTSGTSSSTVTSATAGGAASTNGSATTASSAPSSSSTASSASTNSSSNTTSSSAASKSVGSSAASAGSSKVLNFVTTKHRPRHKVLVGRLL